MGPDLTERLIHEWIDEQAARTPEAVAVTLGPQRLTYGELGARAEAVASTLNYHGAGPETLVGIPADRSIESLVAMLGVLKSGSGYVPFSDLPDARFATLCRRAGLGLFVGSEAAIAALPAHGGQVVLTDVRHLRHGSHGTDRAIRRPQPDNVAYVIFTSGTTGEPKGVITSHAALMHSTRARSSVFPLPGAYLMLAPFAFDAAVAGIYFTLSVGGRLVLPTDEEILDPGLLADLVVREQATHLDGVPSQYAALIAYQGECVRSVGCVVVAGEALSTGLARRHFTVAPSTPLFNEYGPTEGTVWSTIQRFDTAEQVELLTVALAPIGKAIPGASVHVVDEQGHPLADGEEGEILVSGPGLARGYLGDPAQTAARFVPDPGETGARRYRTGDLGRTENSVLHFRGRTDRMVKIRGFRVELDEVEATLNAHPDLSAAAVAAVRNDSGTRLVAFVVAQDSSTCPSAQVLSEFVARVLPPFMVPHTWRGLTAMPLTPSGKVDRARLTAAGETMVLAGIPLTHNSWKAPS